MGLFDRLQRALGIEIRALGAEDGFVEIDDPLLEAMAGSTTVTRQTALQVPTIAGGIDLIANVIASTPIRLYREKDGKTEPVEGDRRVFLLNDEPEENMDADQWWHAIVRDYFLGKGGYAYIEKSRGSITALHYVKCEDVSILRREDPIRKDFEIQVGGRTYQPYEFLRILRNSRDGAAGTPITEESSQLIAVAWQMMRMEHAMAKRGGNKKGFLKSAKPLTKASMDALKEAWRSLYSTGENNAMVLNNGVDFAEVAETSAEMQMNENKRTNAQEFAKLFHISPETASGKTQDLEGLAKLAAIPLMTTIQCALNRDLLRQKEKGTYYWAFDTKELLKGSLKERMDAYATAVGANIMQIDEVRYAEDLEPLGLSWIKIGLQDVLYDPKTKVVYTPNTNQWAQMTEARLTGPDESGMVSAADDSNGEKTDPPLQERAETEERGNPYHDPSNGQFTSGGGTGGNSGLTQGDSGGTLQSSTRPTWTKEEQKKPFDYYEMQPDKAGYPRHLKPSGFSSVDTLAEHSGKHGKGVGATDDADYLAKAQTFFQSPRGQNGDAFVRRNGEACRYDYGTHEFMAVTSRGIIKTYSNLADGKSASYADSYWEGEKKRG
ncbi:MAG: phage portal protein [Oscillospiraceae bacterium]|nr:phage portal protein [Oscillospiraceae bacterium]